MKGCKKDNFLEGYAQKCIIVIISNFNSFSFSFKSVSPTSKTFIHQYHNTICMLAGLKKRFLMDTLTHR